MLRRFLNWLRRLRKREGYAVPKEAEVHILRPTQRRPVYKIPKSQKAVHADVSKFMKHGRQAKWYRKSVKEKKKPEEDES